MISFLVLIITKQQKEQIAKMENISKVIIYWEMHKCNNGIFLRKKSCIFKIFCVTNKTGLAQFRDYCNLFVAVGSMSESQI